MRSSMKALGLVVVSCILAGGSWAGIADSPLPVLVPGVATKHVFSVPGVIKGGSLDTLFLCTSTSTDTIRIGVEVFGPAGSLQNNVAGGDGAIDVAPGATVTIGTGLTAGIATDTFIGALSFVQNGSARIVSTSTSILCTAQVVDFVGSPPASMTSLPMIKKTTQKGD